MDPTEFSSLLNKVHLGATPSFLSSFPDNTISLTITSPPYYDNDLYILDGDVLEFGWRTYEDYLLHLEESLEEIYRITIPGGRIILVISNTPQTDDNGQVTGYWPLTHDLYIIAQNCGWIMTDEAVWIKKDRTYEYQKSHPIPETNLHPQHDIVTVYRKTGPTRRTNEVQDVSSVWKLDHAGPVSEYNKTYPSFPDDLVRRCVNLWSLPHDIVLDPYAGSGQVCRIAMKMDRYVIGVEMDKKWQKLWADINS